MEMPAVIVADPNRPVVASAVEVAEASVAEIAG
jgi:hypothetical protein